jgi:sugar phosphate isomerase/epimerase
MMHPTMEGRSMNVGVFTVGLPDLTPEDAVREIKDAGYDGVEWRVARVPDEVKGDEPSFWGNNLCTLAPTEEEARRARRISEEAGLEYPGLAPTSPSATWRPLRRRCASP